MCNSVNTFKALSLIDSFIIVIQLLNLVYIGRLLLYTEIFMR